MLKTTAQPVLFCLRCGSKWDRSYSGKDVHTEGSPCPDCHEPLGAFFLIPTTCPGASELLEKCTPVESEYV